MKQTAYFRRHVLAQRPYIRLEWCEHAIQEPDFVAVQLDGRIRHWLYVAELGRYLRVITLADGETQELQTAIVMRVEYFSETDTLYIQLLEGQATDTQEVADDIVLDFSNDGRVIGIEIDHASERTDLGNLELASFPLGGATTEAV